MNAEKRKKRGARAPRRERLVDAGEFLEKSLGGPLTLRMTMKAIRECEDMSLTEMGTKLGVSAQHLSDIEHGRKLVSPDRAERFANLLGYSAEQFVRLALQQQLDDAGLPYRITLTPTASRVRRGHGDRHNRASASSSRS